MDSRFASVTKEDIFGQLVIHALCVAYNKTIIHLCVGESGGYLPPLWCLIAKFMHPFELCNEEKMATLVPK